MSNAGKKRGRGKGAGKKNARNLNKGQIIGVGKFFFVLFIASFSSALNTSVIFKNLF